MAKPQAKRHVKVEREDRQAMNWLIWGGALVTLVFFAPANDPFNAPKSWVLSIAGFWLLGWVLLQVRTQIKNRTLLWSTVLSGAYLLALFVAWLATNNKYIGMFGEYQRRTGFLSYLGLVVFLVASSYLFRVNRVLILEVAGVFVGLLTGLYGFAQHFNVDFVRWNNPYNSVLSTLGNPDFAAAAMAIFLVLSFGIAIQVMQPLWFRGVAALNVLMLLTVIIFSQVRQGLLAGAAGVALVVVVWVWQRNKLAAWVLAGLGAVGGVMGVLGMLKMGPLTKYFYKISVTYRGDYWRAGWRMFIHHPLFGVGLDRYGTYFRQYRDATQSLRRGPNLISNAAHDVPVQLASTGGIFVLLTFLALTGFIFWRGVVALRKNSGMEQIVVAIVFGAWITYEVQSLISIDNLAIAIWGYILGGAIIGLSVGNTASSVVKREVTFQPFLSGLLAIVMSIVAIMFFEAETNMKQVASYRVPSAASDVQTYERLALKPISFFFKEPAFEIQIASDYAQAGGVSQSITQLQAVVKNDPHFYDAQNLLAGIYEYEKEPGLAIPIRVRELQEDPYNASLILNLGEDYKAVGQLSQAQTLIPAIDSWDKGSKESQQAHKDFGK